MGNQCDHAVSLLDTAHIAYCWTLGQALYTSLYLRCFQFLLLPPARCWHDATVVGYHRRSEGWALMGVEQARRASCPRYRWDDWWHDTLVRRDIVLGVLGPFHSWTLQTHSPHLATRVFRHSHPIPVMPYGTVDVQLKFWRRHLGTLCAHDYFPNPWIEAIPRVKVNDMTVHSEYCHMQLLQSSVLHFWVYRVGLRISAVEEYWSTTLIKSYCIHHGRFNTTSIVNRKSKNYKELARALALELNASLIPTAPSLSFLFCDLVSSLSALFCSLSALFACCLLSKPFGILLFIVFTNLDDILGWNSWVTDSWTINVPITQIDLLAGLLMLQLVINIGKLANVDNSPCCDSLALDDFQVEHEIL